MLTITATGRYAKCVSDEVITTGSVGIPAVFELNEDYDGISPVAVFRGSGQSFDVALITNETVVPHEVLTKVGGALEVGVYARNGEGTIVIPTIWSSAGIIREGTEPSGIDPSQPTPDWTAQVQAAASEAVETANEAMEIAEAAEEAVTHYPVIINGYWCVWDVTIGEYISTGVEAQGPDGFSPTVVITAITGGHRVTITDANGPHVFDVLDGAKGDPLTYDDLTEEQKADLVQGPILDAQNDAIAAVEAKGEEVIESIPNFQKEIDKKAPAIYASIGPSAIASFSDGAEDMPLKSLVVYIPATQSGTGDPSPENVRPFVGRTTVTVTRTGGNLLGGKQLADDIAASCTGETRDGNAVYLPRGSNSVNSAVAQRVPMLRGGFAPGTHTIIIAQGATDTDTSLITVFYTDGSSTAIGASSYNAAAKRWRYVTPASKTIRFLRMNRDNSAPIEYDCDNSGVFVGNMPIETTVPYDGSVLNIPLPTEAGTVYAGTLTISADGSGTLSVLPHYASYAGETLVGPWVSSMDVYAEGATPTTGAEVIDLGGIATVYPLTAEQIRTLAGDNNIWSDAGTVTVEYPADTKAYIDAQTAELSGEIETLGGEVDALESDVSDISALPIISPPDVETLLDDGEYTDEAKIALQKALGIPNFQSEIIYQGTVSEDSEIVTISADSDGQPFKLRAFKILLELSASTTGNADWITARMTATKASNVDFTASLPTKKMSAATGSLIVYEVETFPGGLMWFMRAYAGRYNSTLSGIETIVQNVEIESVKSFEFRQYSSSATLIPAGSKITIFGIRA